MSHNTNEDNDDDEDVKAYNSCISNAVDITNTYVRNGLVTLTRSARDVDSNVRRNFLYHIPLPPPTTSTSIPPSPPLLSIPPPTETSVKSLCRIPSPSGNQVAIFLEEEDPSNNNNNNNKKQIIEVWTEGGQTLSNRILLPTQKLHGKVCTDTSWFGGFSWHSSSSFNNNNNNKEEDVVEEFLVYVAEALPPSTKSFFHHRTTSGDNEDDTAGSSSSITGGEYTLGLGKGEDWGEKYTSTHRLNLYCVHLPTGNVGMVSNVPGAAATTTTTEGGYVLGQPTFSPCGAYIVYTGWDAGGGGEMPRRLGSVYCYQRRSKIYSSRVSTLLNRLAGRSGTSEKEEEDGVEDGGFVCVTPDDQLARSPRFSSTTTTTTSSSSDCKLIYLCNTKGFDTHGGCMGLHVMDWKNIAAGGGGGGLSIQSRREVVKPVFDFPSIVREDDDDDAGGGVGMNMNLEFPGLFVDQLPNHPCTSPDGMYLYTTTQWGCRRRIIRISLDDGAITPIQFDIRNGPNSSSSDGDDEGDNGRKMASQTLLCLTDNGDAIVSQSTPNSPPTVGFLPSRVLQMADDDDDDGGSKAGGVVLVNPLIKFGAIAATSAFAPFSHVSSSTTTIKGDDRIQCFGIVASPQEGKDGPDVEGILLLPPPDSNNNNDNKNDDAKNTKKIPLLVIPHGGPHSCSTTTFIPSYAFLCKQGYAILHTNFRGSTGYGQSFVESLAGSIGRSDVDDVVALTQRALTFQQSHSHLQQLDANRVGVCGGSHGGFLAGHLIGQHPKLFKVAAMRNMVSNIAGMVTHTDIPDWCYVEGMGIGSYDWKEFRGPKRDELGLMWDKSPIAHIDKVTAPTLVALGMADKRVPPSQGIEYYHALRSKGVKTKLLIYEKDDHAIDRVVSEADHWLNIKRWFDEHL